jgi:hypothetical protein
LLWNQSDEDITGSNISVTQAYGGNGGLTVSVVGQLAHYSGFTRD